ncbi:hypothetical protein EON65_53860 [archaeon]|nr:MAG: hypothetical protein EON65_53860 [archaeon]
MTTTAARQALDLAEQLIATIARAFYPDDVVVVLDALVREKYLIDREIGPRLKMSEKDVRKVINQLETEMLIKAEDVPLGDGASFWHCYYVDYQVFVNIVRYRVFLMQQRLNKQESSELSEVQYKCPTCKNVFSSLDALKLLSSDHKFICSHCCPHENCRTLPAEPYFTLIEIDNRRKISSLQTQQKKMSEQFCKDKDLHLGIFELLSKLKDVQLPHNLPSENMKKFVVPSAIEDEEVLKAIKHNLTYSKSVGGSYLSKKAGQDPMKTLLSLNQKANKYDVHIADGPTEASSQPPTQQHNLTSTLASSTLISAMDTSYIYKARAVGMPEFLQNSRVKGADEVLSNVAAIQRDRQQQLLEEATQETVESVPTAESKAEEGGGNAMDDDQDLDDVAWEDS